MKYQWTLTIHCQWIRIIYPDNMAMYIHNMIPISLRNSSKRYSARHRTSEHRDSTTKDFRTRDIKFSTHNTTSEHCMSMSQHIKPKVWDLSTKPSPHNEVARRQSDWLNIFTWGYRNYVALTSVCPMREFNHPLRSRSTLGPYVVQYWAKCWMRCDIGFFRNVAIGASCGWGCGVGISGVVGTACV